MVNDVYGDYRNPNELGSGGGHDGQQGGNGGGLIRIKASILNLEGGIKAVGGQTGGNGNNRGCGSGGGIYIEVKTIRGSGEISGDGGSRNENCSTGGGGGRVALYYEENSGFDLNTKIHAYGGYGWNGETGIYVGGAGTIYIKKTTEAEGQLIIKGRGTGSVPASTPIQHYEGGAVTAVEGNMITVSVGNYPVTNISGGESGLAGLPIMINGVEYKIKSNTANTITLDTPQDLSGAINVGDVYVNPNTDSPVMSGKVNAEYVNATHLGDVVVDSGYLSIKNGMNIESLTVKTGAIFYSGEEQLTIGTLTIDGEYSHREMGC